MPAIDDIPLTINGESMCLQDWRIGRLITTAPRALGVVSNGDVLAAANRQRVGITISSLSLSAPLSGSVTIGVDGIEALVMFDAQPPLHLTLVTHGLLPTKKFTVHNVSASVTVGVVEYFAPEEYLAEAIESFRRSYPLWPK